MLTCTVKHDEEIVHETVKESMVRKLSHAPSLANNLETVHTMNAFAREINPVYGGTDFSEAAYVKICEDEHSTSITIDRTSFKDLPSSGNLIQKSENKITVKHNHNKVSSTVSTSYATENPLYRKQHTSTKLHHGKQFQSDTPTVC